MPAPPVHLWAFSHQSEGTFYLYYLLPAPHPWMNQTGSSGLDNYLGVVLLLVVVLL